MHEAVYNGPTIKEAGSPIIRNGATVYVVSRADDVTMVRLWRDAPVTVILPTRHVNRKGPPELRGLI